MARVCIYDSSTGSGGIGVGVGSSLKKAVVPQLPPGSIYLEEVHVKVSLSLSPALYLSCQIELPM
jgi:hypothetical protein